MTTMILRERERTQSSEVRTFNAIRYQPTCNSFTESFIEDAAGDDEAGDEDRAPFTGPEEIDELADKYYEDLLQRAGSMSKYREDTTHLEDSNALVKVTDTITALLCADNCRIWRIKCRVSMILLSFCKQKFTNVHSWDPKRL